MRRRQFPRPARQIRRATGVLGVTALGAALVGVPSSMAQASTGATSVTQTDSAVLLTVPATDSSPGYRVQITRSPFQITISRGDEVVLRATQDSSSTVDFNTPTGMHRATDVRSARWQDGGLVGDLVLGAIDRNGYISRVNAHAAQPPPVRPDDQRPAGVGCRSGALALRL